MREEGCKDGAERHHSAASGGKLQVDPPYFEHGGCSAVAGFGRCLLGRHQRAPRAAGGHRPVKRLAEAPFAATATVGVLRIWAPDNSRVSRSMDTCIDTNRALLYTATMARDGGSNDAKRKKAPQSAVARWANGVDSPCEAQTPPSPTNPERPPLSRCIDVLTESWCAALHQAVLCAQRQDVVVAHQTGVRGYFTNQFTPARERKGRQLECMLER